MIALAHAKKTEWFHKALSFLMLSITCLNAFAMKKAAYGVAIYKGLRIAVSNRDQFTNSLLGTIKEQY